MKTFLHLFIVVIAITSCQNANFSRNGRTSRTGAGTQSQNPTTTANGKNPNGTTATNPNGTATNNTKNPYLPGGIFFDESDHDGNLWAAGNPFFVDFGAGQIWHIGDDGWDGTACKAKMIFRFVVRATEFNFNFEVLEDNTTLSASLRYCGVDYVGSKFYIVGPGGNNDIRDDVPISLTADKGIFTPYTRATSRKVVLNKGWHKIRVVSVVRGTDRDNYLVGRVNLDPDKAVRVGDITSN